MSIPDLPGDWVISASVFNWTPEIIAAREEAPQIALEVVRSGLANRIEIEAGQLWRGFPGAADQEVSSFRESLDSESGGVSIVGLSIDEVDESGRSRSEDERLEFLLPQLDTAHRVGARGVRLPIGQAGTRLLHRMIPTLDSLDLVLYEEIQGQQTADHPVAGRAIDEIVALDSPRVRLLVDISMLMPALPPSYLDALEAGGVPASLLTALGTDWRAPETLSEVLDLLRSGGVPPRVHTLYMDMLVRFGRSRAEDLRALLPWVGAIHLKFWDLDDEDGRITRPITELATELARAGFVGTLCSEWGGHEWLDRPASDMTRAHLDIARRALRAGIAQ